MNPVSPPTCPDRADADGPSGGGVSSAGLTGEFRRAQRLSYEADDDTPLDDVTPVDVGACQTAGPPHNINNSKDLASISPSLGQLGDATAASVLLCRTEDYHVLVLSLEFIRSIMIAHCQKK
jgi:hypothetical protein